VFIYTERSSQDIVDTTANSVCKALALLSPVHYTQRLMISPCVANSTRHPYVCMHATTCEALPQLNARTVLSLAPQSEANRI